MLDTIYVDFVFQLAQLLLETLSNQNRTGPAPVRWCKYALEVRDMNTKVQI